MTKGKFITLEGVEGVGKSTNLELISALVKSGGHDVLVTREPGGTTLGERVREILLDKDEHGMTPMAELLLMFAARAQHVEEVIKPALARGTWVVSDRFTDSSYAYQGGGRQLGSNRVAELEHQVLGGFKPDLVVILDLDVQAGLERASKVSEADRFESEERAFFERVRAAFIGRSTKAGYQLVDAGRPLADVQADITIIIKKLFE
ncbi:MAG: dTMP kinase [Gammaproteobacteria bacterium]|jgi:dTMP kinase|nr:dTMP kinase [Gammaproteobacteria bacterium]MBT5686382.1 dTMP kinase [Gammaproteobacteria bacterium]MBT6893082.1 dTMP kinase [Gammaproteobacteria bacterium]MBT7879621.1 dTMP kinase [Gammaproteobacteria bacterium]